MEEIQIFNKLLKLNPTPGKKHNIKDILINNVYILPGWINSNKDPIQVKYKNINKFLSSLGYTTQIFYDIFILGLCNIADRPVCPICKEKVDFINFIKGYNKTCKNKTCRSKFTSNQVQNLWLNSSYRETQTNSHIKWAEDPTNREKLKQTSLRIWNDSTYREAQTNSHIKWAQDPVNKNNMSKITKQLWSDPIYRERQCNSHKQWAINNPDKVMKGTRGFVYSNKMGINIGYDSTWEKQFIEFCDQETNILSIQRSTLNIPYEIDGEKHYYFPDFHVKLSSGELLLIEIKAKWQIQQDHRTTIKLQKGKEFINNSLFNRYIVLTEDELFTNNKFDSEKIIAQLIK